MAGVLRVSPEELYCLGELLHAEYMDYSYIAAMDKYSRDMSLMSKDARSSLVKKGVLSEDFSGDIIPNGDYLELLDPVFFSALEISADVYKVLPEQGMDSVNIHYYDGKVTMVKPVGTDLELTSVSEEDVKNALESVLEISEPSEQAVFDKDNVSRIISLKCLVPGRSASVSVIMESGGAFFTETADAGMQRLSSDDFLEKVFDFAKEI